jgi:hypothetical protein
MLAEQHDLYMNRGPATPGSEAIDKLFVDAQAEHDRVHARIVVVGRRLAVAVVPAPTARDHGSRAHMAICPVQQIGWSEARCKYVVSVMTPTGSWRESYVATAAFETLAAMIAKWPRRLTESQLSKQSGRDGRRALNRLVAEHSDRDLWQAVIYFPTHGDTGYGFRDPTSPIVISAAASL